MSSQKYRCNDEIKTKYVYLINEDGKAMGEINRAEALYRAKEVELDLVEIQPNKNKDEYPVCRIMDYGKFLYDKQKKVAQSKKQQKKSSVKGMRFGTNIGEHDFDVKISQVKKFLQSGDKVRLNINVSNKRGSDKFVKEQAYDMFDKIEDSLKDTASFDKVSQGGGYGRFLMTVMPLKQEDKPKSKKSVKM